MVLESGPPAVVVRPSHVYGPGGWYGEELVPRLRQPGRFAVIGSGANLWDVVHVEDVAAAILLAVGDDAANGRVYHVADDEPITYYDFMALTASELASGARGASRRRWRAWLRVATLSMPSCARRARRTRASRASWAGSRASRPRARACRRRGRAASRRLSGS